MQEQTSLEEKQDSDSVSCKISEVKSIDKNLKKIRYFQFGLVFFVPFVLIFSVIVIWFIINNKPSYPDVSSQPDSRLPVSELVIAYSLEKALKTPEKISRLMLCNKDLKSVPPSIGTLTNVEFMDLSGNRLTNLPSEMSKLNSLNELVLVNNYFNESEQKRVKQLLPHVDIAFIPQNYFDPFIDDDWKNYTTTRHGFSFRYHHDLKIEEGDNEVKLYSDLAGLAHASGSCHVEEAYINMVIKIKDNPKNLSPVEYLEEAWKIKIFQVGDNYIPDQDRGIEIYLDYIDNYKNGELEGLIADAGESEHPRIITTHNNKFFIFHLLPGGETGSGVPEIAKTAIEQTLSTFRYTK